MNLSTITRPLALIAVGALALAGCAAAEPTPAETVYVTVEPEPTPAMEDDWMESDDLINLAMEMAWTDASAEDRESICWGINILGDDWFAENWDETSGIPVSLAHEFLEGKCS